MSAIINIAAGSSSLRDDDLEAFQGGGHDPKKRGFSLQQMELAISGTVDDLFDAEAYAVFSQDEVELEEAFITTRSLPYGLQLKAGYYLTEFGIVNSQHLHSWDFLDQPIINSRLFGGEGLRSAGARISWLAPTPWYSELILGVQNADSDHAVSFRGEGHAHGEEEHDDDDDHEFEEAVGGRPYFDSDTRSLGDFIWSGRWINTFEMSEDTTFQLGISGLYGDNHTGGNTFIYGADFKLVVDDKELGRPGFIWQTEIMKRQYNAEAITFEHGMDTETLESESMNDWGFYTQVIKALDQKWSAGIRFEYASGTGNSYEEGDVIDRDNDFNRSNRYRVSPLLTYQHSEFTKLRLQYNYDDSDTGDNGSTIWLGVEVLLGKHPAHKF
jgi:hypothetical protein